MATVDQIGLRIRQRSDNEHSTSDFIDPDELIGLVDTHHKELYALLVENNIHQIEATQSLTATGALTYPVLDDYYGVVGVFRVESGSRLPLGRHDWRFKLNPSVTGPAVTYRIFNDGTSGLIEFDPIPASGDYEIRYIPRPTDLTAGNQDVDGVLGWEEYIVCAGARDVFEKEGNLDAAATQEAKRNRLELRIKKEAANRELTQSYRIQNVRARTDNVWQEGAYLDRTGVRGAWYRPWWRR